VVGAGGFGAPLIFAIIALQWSRTFTIVIVLIVTVTLIDLLSGSIRKKLV